MDKILNNIVDVFAIVGGLYAFYNIFVLKIFWKPKLYLNNGKLVCENDGDKTIVIEMITAKSNANSYVAKNIRTRIGKELQKTNIIFCGQSCELEFDIEYDNFKSGLILVEYKYSDKTKNQTVKVRENEPVHFINNRQMKIKLR